jgi:glycosyltransferase involved in cell wall biosynthesis
MRTLFKLIAERKIIRKTYSALPLWARRAVVNLVLWRVKRKLLKQPLRYNKISPDLPKGVNIIGFIKGQLGLGELARGVGAAIGTTQLDVAFYDYSKVLNHGVGDRQVQSAANNLYNINISCLSQDSLMLLYKEVGESFFRGRYNINYVSWELETYPDSWLPALSLSNEVWALSDFVADSVRKKTTLPVFTMPIPIDFVVPNKYGHKHFSLPEEKFLFLFSFDMSSSTHRKNPQMVIKAFQQAFSKSNDNTGLVIKLSRIKGRPEFERMFGSLMGDIRGDKRIYIIDKVLGREEVLDLINVCDSYVSLHRSEGFGMGMAEAMKMGKPVIATNYSGNLQFMNKENSCLVDYKLVPVKRGEYIYYKGQAWAEPDMEHAASYMKKLVSDSAYRKKIGKNAKAYMDKYYNHRVLGESYYKRLDLSLK